MSDDIRDILVNEGKKIIISFTSAITNTGLYSVNHPQTVAAFNEIFDAFEKLFVEIMEFQILLLDSKILINKIPISDKGLYFKKFAKKMKAFRIESLTFSEGITRDELSKLILYLSKTTARKGNEINDFTNSDHIKIGSVGIKKGKGNSGEDDEILKEFSDEVVDIQEYIRVLGEFYDYIKQFQELARRSKKLQINPKDLTNKIEKFVFSFLKKQDDKVEIIHKISEKEYDFTHTLNVVMLTLAMADAIDINEEFMEDIALSALLYDIGKSDIPESILNKKGIYSPAERKMIENHPILGAKKLMKMEGIPSLAVIVAFEHHMPYDLTGSGYPRFSLHKRPNLISQIVGMADYFDAMHLSKPYRKAYSVNEIVNKLIMEAGKKFDPFLVKIFIERVLPRF